MARQYFPMSPNPDDCNCLQCRELRVYSAMRDYFSNPANCLSLTPSEVETYWHVTRMQTDLARMLVNRDFVLCKDGFIRPNFRVFQG